MGDMATDPKHLMLGEVIARLKAEDPAKRIRVGFTYPHSYRGDYRDLAFEIAGNITVEEMLAAAESAVGTTYEGWRGGDFEMDDRTDCWLVGAEGTSVGETLGAVLLDFMLDAEVPSDATRIKPDSEMTFDERMADG